MPRRVQDIVPNNHRSIRDIPVEHNTIIAPIQPPKERKTRAKSNVHRDDMLQKVTKSDFSGKEDGGKENQSVPIRRISVTPPHKKKKNGSKKWILIPMGIVVVVAGVGYVASVYFSHASFSIVPKVIPISIDSTYISQNTAGKGVLSYEIAAVKGSATATVPATDGQKTSTAAKGKITLYNSYSAQSQRLIAGTRLSDNTGRIYRLTSSVVIPGYTSSAGSVIPGSLSATITADQPGQSYNISRSDSISDFKIVAYKGSAKYDAIYARLTTDVTGGFTGVKKIVSSTVLASSTTELQKKVTASLLDQIKNTVPQGYIMYPKSYVVLFSAPTTSGDDPKSATVTVQGTLYGILFKKSELIARVAGDQTVSEFDGFSFDTPGLESLDFSIANQKDFSPEKKNSLIIKLKGNMDLVGGIPVEELKKKLSGLSLSETAEVLRHYKPVIDIDKSSGEITPPWSKVPANPDRITIKVLTK